MNRVLTFTLCALMLSAPALAQPERKIYMEKPVGDGDPNATSCYPEPSSNSRQKKFDCRRNSEWAAMYAAEKHATRMDTGRLQQDAPVNVMH